VEPNLANGFIGGLLIGLAAVLLLALNGRIAGVSGIFGGIFTTDTSGERGWRIAFVLGLIGGTMLYIVFRGGLALQLQATGWTLLAGGFLVGFGTRLGSGCTSGHGVCGLARRSPRSFTATIIFMVTAVITVFVTHHLFR
jgi:uncharacterized membrane protein YedE/YeeE